jgi:hypothetical protein
MKRAPAVVESLPCAVAAIIMFILSLKPKLKLSNTRKMKRQQSNCLIR